MKSSENSTFKKTARSILYDNQAFFIAYWMEDSTDTSLMSVLDDILLDRVIVKDYAKHQVTTRKTQQELDTDMEELEKDVQTRLQDDNFRLTYYLRSGQHR